MNEDSLSHRQTNWTLGNKPICQVYWVEHLCGGASKIQKNADAVEMRLQDDDDCDEHIMFQMITMMMLKLT